MGLSIIAIPAPDAVPDPIAFADKTNVSQSSLTESDLVTLSGFNQPVTAVVTNGELSVNSGPFTSLAAVVFSGDTVQVRHTSSSNPDSAVISTLSLGGVGYTFTSITRVASGNGWPGYREVPDPSQALGFDVYGEYAYDSVLTSQTNIVIDQGGTPGNPRVYDGRGVTCAAFGTTVDHVIVDGLTVATSGEGPVRSQGSFVALRDFNVSGNNTDFGAGSAVTLGNMSVWLRGMVSNFGVLDPQYQEQDQHGFKIQADDIWILEVVTTQLSGDGVQIGDATRGAGNRVYVCGGRHFNNRENAVDIKDSQDCMVVGVEMYGYGQTISSPGEAVIIHDDSFRAKVYDCDIHDTRLGIVSSGFSAHTIDSNTISTGGSYTVYPQGDEPFVQSIVGLDGIQLRNTRPITVTNNIISGSPRINIQGGMSHPDTVIQGQNGVPDTI